MLQKYIYFHAVHINKNNDNNNFKTQATYGS